CDLSSALFSSDLGPRTVRFWPRERAGRRQRSPYSKSRSLRTRQRPGEGQSPPRRTLWLPSEGADLQEKGCYEAKTLSFWGEQSPRLPRYVLACVTPEVVVVSSSASETPRWARTNGSAWRAESSGGQSRGGYPGPCLRPGGARGRAG